MNINAAFKKIEQQQWILSHCFSTTTTTTTSHYDLIGAFCQIMLFTREAAQRVGERGLNECKQFSVILLWFYVTFYWLHFISLKVSCSCLPISNVSNGMIFKIPRKKLKLANQNVVAVGVIFVVGSGVAVAAFWLNWKCPIHFFFCIHLI